MAHRNTGAAHICPVCNAPLTSENGALRCEAHGVFFAYGPQLLVRMPSSNGKRAELLMPWEHRKPVALKG